MLFVVLSTSRISICVPFPRNAASFQMGVRRSSIDIELRSDVVDRIARLICGYQFVDFVGLQTVRGTLIASRSGFQPLCTPVLPWQFISRAGDDSFQTLPESVNPLGKNRVRSLFDQVHKWLTRQTFDGANALSGASKARVWSFAHQALLKAEEAFKSVRADANCAEK